MVILICLLPLIAREPTQTQVWTLPESRGCIWPIKVIKHSKTELKRIVPFVQIHKCKYDTKHRLIRVSTFNFEIGYQMKKPTKEVLYKWDRTKLEQYSIRKASHGNGEVDAEVFNFHD